MGMTNGEKFKEVFGISQVDEGELYAFAWLPNHDVPAEFIIDWWNAEYKAKGVLSKFNKITKTITPQEPRKGHWIRISPAEVYECSECGQNVMTSDICAYKFCHGCGAKMVEPQGGINENKTTNQR